MALLHQQIAVLDFGSQYTHLIARRFRQLGVLAKLYQPTEDLSKIDNLIGIVLSGGPGSAGDKEYPYNPEIFNQGVPVLGHCFGHHLIAHHLGGQVTNDGTGEYGLATIQVGESDLFEGLEGGEVVWMSHGDQVTKLPEGFKTIGGTSDCPIAAMADEAKNIYGLQFHPEVTHSVHGMTILKNFAYKICQAKQDWQIEDWEKQMIKQIKKQVGNKKVFLLVSGGVDSTVCFALLEKALGQDKVFGLHVDTGMMRKNEVEQVKGSLAQAGFKNLEIKDASEQFLLKLKNVYEPEEKRKIIGQLFLDIQKQVSQEFKLNPDEWLLGQGTIYPDTIETGGTHHADTIKTHHNRIDKIQELIEQGKVIEPIKDLYKDEVRDLGELLGLSEKLVWRQPFPGPGLGIRALCNNVKLKVKNEKFDDDVKNKIKNQRLKIKEVEAKIKKIIPSKYQVQVLPIKSVGVQGDYRTYANPCVLELPTTNYQLPTIDWSKIEVLSPKITNKVRDVNRVLLKLDTQYTIQDTGELIEATITKKRLDLLREIDAIVQEEIFKADLERDIWQFPVVLIPFGVNGKESVVLRPVSSLEAMTARFYPLESEILQLIVSRIESLDQTSFIFYDVTNKPPGTIEWE